MKQCKIGKPATKLSQSFENRTSKFKQDVDPIGIESIDSHQLIGFIPDRIQAGVKNQLKAN